MRKKVSLNRRISAHVCRVRRPTTPNSLTIADRCHVSTRTFNWIYVLSIWPPSIEIFYRSTALRRSESVLLLDRREMAAKKKSRKKNSMSYVENVDTCDARYFFCWFRCCVCYVYQFVHWNRLNDLWSFENGTHTQFCQWMGTDPLPLMLTRVHCETAHTQKVVGEHEEIRL